MFLIALKMLIGDKGKYLGIILGVSFASLIMTQQPGVFLGIMSRGYSFITDINIPDIWVMDPAVKFIDDVIPLSSTQQYRVASVTGVKWAKPLYKGGGLARLPNGQSQKCDIIGIDDATLIGGPSDMVYGELKNLRHGNSIIINEEGILKKLQMTDPKTGNITYLKYGDSLELNDHRAVIVGTAKTNSTFFSNPVIYTTFSRVKDFVPGQRKMLSYVLVKAQDGESPEKVASDITKKTGLKALTKEDFKQTTYDYYVGNTGIAINFSISVLLGFLVGAAVAGQTFYNFTQENLKYFGVLKAMGTSQKTLVLMILLQALTVGIIGYGIGLALTTFFFWLSQSNALLAFRFTWGLMIFSAVGVGIITAIAALMSARKVLKLEAAIVFKG